MLSLPTYSLQQCHHEISGKNVRNFAETCGVLPILEFQPSLPTPVKSGWSKSLAECENQAFPLWKVVLRRPVKLLGVGPGNSKKVSCCHSKKQLLCHAMNTPWIIPGNVGSLIIILQFRGTSNWRTFPLVFILKISREIRSAIIKISSWTFQRNLKSINIRKFRIFPRNRHLLLSLIAIWRNLFWFVKLKSRDQRAALSLVVCYHNSRRFRGIFIAVLTILKNNKLKIFREIARRNSVFLPFRGIFAAVLISLKTTNWKYSAKSQGATACSCLFAGSPESCQFLGGDFPRVSHVWPQPCRNHRSQWTNTSSDQQGVPFGQLFQHCLPLSWAWRQALECPEAPVLRRRRQSPRLRPR